MLLLGASIILVRLDFLRLYLRTAQIKKIRAATNNTDAIQITAIAQPANFFWLEFAFEIVADSVDVGEDVVVDVVDCVVVLREVSKKIN